MFAVLKTGGKQYRVKSGDMLRVEKLAADAGEKVQFNEVLMLGGDDLVVGAPLVDDAAVQAEVVDTVKGDKVINYVKRRRKHSSQRTRGHRQQLTLLRVTEILAKGAGKSGVKAAIGAGSVTVTAAAPKAEKKAAPKKAEAKAEAPKAEAPKAAAADDLTEINGVGPAALKKLNEAGITTFAQLAAIDADSFDAVKVKPEWIEQAKELSKG
ncbi:50S ribosomal protein L21 [Pseudooceanicola sp.]|uniref:50S ribosomal protein L21 n=1 Tax=Pseudooceanicola sp. TaxID=1914328 RepID=UPI0035C77359